mmetsp:Transcript_1032/g.2015  ORF Transcript_1032/g.2015 Transcript_1032/m.2015 type:complete len:358 (-) Transcript_1032:91-1164(-)
MSNVHDSSKGTSKDRSNDGSNTVGNHSFTDRVRISCFLSRHETHHISETGGDTKGQDGANVITNVAKALNKGITSPGSTSDGFRNFTLGSIQPTGKASKGDNWDGFRDVKPLGNVESSHSVVLGKNEKDWDQSNRRNGKVTSNLVECQPRKANASKWDQHGSDGEVTHHEFTKESQKDVDATCQKVGSDTNLPSLGDTVDFFGFGAGLSRAFIGEKDTVDDSKDERKSTGSVQTIRLSGVGLLILVGKANSLPSVVDVSYKEHDTSSRDNPLKEDLLQEGLGGSSAESTTQAENGTRETKQCREVIKEERKERHEISRSKGDSSCECFDFICDSRCALPVKAWPVWDGVVFCHDGCE